MLRRYFELCHCATLLFLFRFVDALQRWSCSANANVTDDDASQFRQDNILLLFSPFCFHLSGLCIVFFYLNLFRCILFFPLPPLSDAPPLAGRGGAEFLCLSPVTYFVLFRILQVDVFRMKYLIVFHSRFSRMAFPQ